MPPFELEVEQALAPAPLEDRDEHAVGGGDGEQVEQDRLERDHDRAEGDEQEPEGEQQDEAEDERHRLGLGGVEVLRVRRRAGDGVLDAVDLADRLRQQRRGAGSRAPRRARRRCRCRRAGSRPSRRCRSRLIVDVDRAVHLAAGERLLLELGDRLLHRRRPLTSSALIATTAGSGVPGNALMKLLERLDRGRRDALHAGLRGVELERRHGQREQDGGRGDARRRRGRRSTRSRIAAPDAALRRRRGAGGRRTGCGPSRPGRRASTSTAGRTVSEPSIATATTIIVPTEKDMNVLSPERNMPAIAIRTVMPETSTA